MMNYNSIPTQGAAGQAQQAAQDPNVVGQITPRPQTPISPKAFTNQATISGVFGQAVPGTYNRMVGSSPLMQSAQQGQMTSQGYMPGLDPTNPSVRPDLEALQASTGMPVPPPAGVQQPITPYYDLSNQ